MRDQADLWRLCVSRSRCLTTASNDNWQRREREPAGACQCLLVPVSYRISEVFSSSAGTFLKHQLLSVTNCRALRQVRRSGLAGVAPSTRGWLALRQVRRSGLAGVAAGQALGAGRRCARRATRKGPTAAASAPTQSAINPAPAGVQDRRDTGHTSRGARPACRYRTRRARRREAQKPRSSCRAATSLQWQAP